MEYLTKEGLEKLKEELSERKKRRQLIARRLEEAKALGDLSENVEYAQTKEEQSFNEGRIAELERVIARARVYQQSGNGSKKVGLGSAVTVAPKIANRVNKKNSRQFFIVGSQEAAPLEGKISSISPIGKALLDHEVNDEVEVITPRGRQKYVIIKIN